jgi:hypothetical protein
MLKDKAQLLRLFVWTHKALRETYGLIMAEARISD